MPIVQSVLELANSTLESADYSADYEANPVKIGVWVWAFTLTCIMHCSNSHISLRSVRRNSLLIINHHLHTQPNKCNFMNLTALGRLT